MSTIRLALYLLVALGAAGALAVWFSTHSLARLAVFIVGLAAYGAWNLWLVYDTERVFRECNELSRELNTAIRNAIVRHRA